MDYKSMLHSEAFLEDWYERVHKVYDFKHINPPSGETTYSASLKVSSATDTADLRTWRDLGITHIITFADGLSSLEPLAKNKTFSLYKIP